MCVIQTMVVSCWNGQLKVKEIEAGVKDVCNYRYKVEVKEMLPEHSKWMKDDPERIASAKNLPYSLRITQSLLHKHFIIQPKSFIRSPKCFFMCYHIVFS